MSDQLELALAQCAIRGHALAQLHAHALAFPARSLSFTSVHYFTETTGIASG